MGAAAVQPGAASFYFTCFALSLFHILLFAVPLFTFTFCSITSPLLSLLFSRSFLSSSPSFFLTVAFYRFDFSSLFFPLSPTSLDLLRLIFAVFTIAMFTFAAFYLLLGRCSFAFVRSSCTLSPFSLFPLLRLSFSHFPFLRFTFFWSSLVRFPLYVSHFSFSLLRFPCYAPVQHFS